MKVRKYLTIVIWFVLLLMLAAALGACDPPVFDLTASPEPTLVIMATSTAQPAVTALATFASTDTPAPSPTAAPSDTPAPSPTAKPTATLTPTPLPPTATPAMPQIVRVEPTFTPHPGDERARMAELPLGEPGHYVNVTFGYWLQYPAEWYTGFGNRPLLVSFSNLDPGSHNRISQRAEGCLLEISAASNIYGFTFEGLTSQLPGSFPDAQPFELDGQAALRVRRGSGDNPFEREEVYVEHDGRLFVITFDYATEAVEVCRPVWEEVLASWQWFTPQFAVSRNTDFGYAVAHPRSWYRFDPTTRGIGISSEDPSGATDLQEFLAGAMLVQTTVNDNSEGLPLKEWLASQDLKPDLTNDILLEDITGIRVLREGPVPGTQEMIGYFQGPLGKIYSVTCLYSLDHQYEFRPIANAIIYSFEF